MNDFPDVSAATRPIIAVDGEGWNIPLSANIESCNPSAYSRGWHSYTMMAAADDIGSEPYTLVHDWSRAERDTEHNIARNYGLSTRDCVEFLLDLPADALKVAFYFSYDATKLFADMPDTNIAELSSEAKLPDDPDERARAIETRDARKREYSSRYGLSLAEVDGNGFLDGNTTIWDEYLITYIPRKQLRIIDLKAGRIMSKRNRGRKDWARKVTVWDVFGFFQKPFVGALRDYRCGKCERCRDGKQCEAIATEAEIARIAEMKEHRGDFTDDETKEILAYCISECRYLAALMRDLLMHIDALGLAKSMSRYDGSGAVAGAWMKREGIKRYRHEIEMTDEGVFYAGLPEEIALRAYVGGRFEISEMGYMGPLYSYDINSAYPAIATPLPCLAHGYFLRVTEYVPDAYGVYLVGSLTEDFSNNRFAPFAFRADEEMAKLRSVGKFSVYYAHGGTRWAWQDEVRTAIQHFGAERIPIHDGYVWIPGCDEKPFRAIPEMYAERQRMVREGNGAEKVIKLIINSIYGKTAQSVGWSMDKRSGKPNPPPFQSFIWAGMITSGCRAMILDGIMRGDVVSIATDGILSRTPIDLYCPDEKILGAWEGKRVEDAYLFQSGVYYMIDPKKPDKPIYKTRGFSPKEIPAEDLISAWKDGRHIVRTREGATRFVPMKSGILRTDGLEYIGQWIDSEHDVSFTHTRREPVVQWDSEGFPIVRKVMPLSTPFVFPHDVLSAPYVPKESWEDVYESRDSEGGDFLEAERDSTEDD